MGDLDPKLVSSIKKTQELLGKYVKKPPLSEKNLARPPFRFLHDVVTTIISSTGFLNGVLSPDEMDSAKITTKEAKTAFIQKIINAIKEATGDPVSAKISKVLAGQEPDKTNELLQSLARAIEKSGGAVDAGKPSMGKQAVGSKAKGKETAAASTSKDKKPVGKVNPVKTEAPGTKKPSPGGPTKKVANSSVKPKTDDKAKKTVRDPSSASKNETKADESKVKGSRPAVKAPIPTTSTQDSVPTGNVKESIQTENENAFEGAGSESTQKSTSSSTLKRQNSSLRIKTDAGGDPFDEAAENASISLGGEAMQQSKGLGIVDLLHNEQHITMYDDFKNSSIKPNMETLTVPTSPIIPESSVMQMALVPEIPVMKKNSGDNLNVTNSARNGKSANSGGPGPSSGANDDKTESQDGISKIDPFSDGGTSNAQIRNRTGTGTSRVSSSRPPSARPAPPRPRSSLFKEAEESNYRPTTGKVSNVMLDSYDTQDDDDNFVIRETAVTKGLDDLDETPELALTSDFDANKNNEQHFLPPEQRGLLVNQILETQKELEDKENDKKDMQGKSDLIVNTKSREVTLAEIEKLKNLIQVCARSANPLGKLLDYVREDMDAMQKELAKWRDESRQLDLELEAAKQATETSLQPLQQQLKDVEVRIQDKEDAIAQTKMTILKHQERIEKILTGLDRVQSSHGKISIPSASQLMQQKKETTASFMEDAILIPERPNSSSNFGSAVNRYAKSSSGMRPIFPQSDDLENLDDPDSFNPWKD